MNSISDFLVSHMIGVYFGYGLAFFVLGLSLVLSSRRESGFRFASVIMPLALFGLLHGSHEWFEMFQRIGIAAGTYTPVLWHELVRVILLALSFVMLLAFGILLMRPETSNRYTTAILITTPVLLWIGLTAFAAWLYALGMPDAIAVSDVLARYMLGIPGAVVAAWALMTQQRIFRESNLSEFGSDLVWCATALLLYGLVGQAFVRPTALPIPAVLDSANFLTWFGMPVQLFRAVLAALLTVFMLRALRVFAAEERRRFQESNEAKLRAQSAALEVEKSAAQHRETINRELTLATQKLSLLVDISNTLTGRAIWPVPLVKSLEQIVDTLTFAKAGLVLLDRRDGKEVYVAAEVGFRRAYQIETRQSDPRRAEAISLGELSIKDGVAHCTHLDGRQIEFTLEEALLQQQCRNYRSPTVLVALPLKSADRIIGSLVLANDPVEPIRISSQDLSLMVGISQELGISVENALLHRQALDREKALAALLGKIVDAQEGERQRIARELHDATGQSLTAVALGLRGIETQLQRICERQEVPLLLEQLHELQTFSTGAMRELHAIIADLRPPQLDELGLIAAIRWYIRTFEKRWGINVQLAVNGDDARLPNDFKTVLFRILQEAMLNVAKHAHANRVDVCLNIGPAEVDLTVRDDGTGFDIKSLGSADGNREHWGMAGMNERTNLVGGTLSVESEPGEGTVVAVHVPLSGIHVAEKSPAAV